MNEVTAEEVALRERRHLRWMGIGALLCLVLGMVTGGAGILAWEQRSRRTEFEVLQASIRATLPRTGLRADGQARYSIGCNVSACYRLDSISGEVKVVPPGRGI